MGKYLLQSAELLEVAAVVLSVVVIVSFKEGMKYMKKIISINLILFIINFLGQLVHEMMTKDLINYVITSQGPITSVRKNFLGISVICSKGAQPIPNYTIIFTIIAIAINLGLLIREVYKK